MSFRVSFFVPGEPKTAGSKRALPIFRGSKGSANRQWMRNVVVDDTGQAGKNWRAVVQVLAKDAMRGSHPYAGALHVTFEFFRLRPKSHLTSKGELRKGVSQHWVQKPDALKLARAAEDAMSKIVWVDDAQIVDEKLKKAYGDKEGMLVTVEGLEG